MFNRYILIKNTGEVDPASFELLGASTKRDDSTKIGFFGSGIKYSIAYLLRNELFFEVWAGEKKIRFEVEEVKLRDQVFNRVLVNDNTTSLTTEWGTSWDRWQIFREIVCNAMDEGRYSIDLVDEVIPQENETHFYLHYADFVKYLENFDNYFYVAEDHGKSSNEGSLVEKEKPSQMVVFKQGIRVVQEDIEFKSLFNYNLPSISLNEERLADTYSIISGVKELLLSSYDKEIIKDLYETIINYESEDQGIFEIDKVFKELDYYYGHLSKEWLNVINEAEYLIAPSDSQEALLKSKGFEYIHDNKIEFLPTKFYKLLVKTFKKDLKKTFKSIKLAGNYELIKKTPRQKVLLKRATDYLEASGISIRKPIYVVSFYETSTWSGSDDMPNCILLSDKCFSKGLSYVIAQILKEHFIQELDCYEVLADIVCRVNGDLSPFKGIDIE